MVKIDENFKRRIRIVGKPGEVRGLGVEVQDADTGEVIDDIFRAIVRLDASSINTVVLSYYDNPIRKSDASDRPVTNTITVTNPEMDITAWEVDTIESDARDEHFAGFAKLLVDELQLDPIDDDNYRGIPQYKRQQKIRQIIAQRAYDLVAHTLFNVEHINLDRLDITEHAERIPDMTGWEEITQYLNFESTGKR